MPKTTKVKKKVTKTKTKVASKPKKAAAKATIKISKTYIPKDTEKYMCEKHKVFFQIFGAQDWAYYLLSQIFVIIAFYYVFKLANEILNNLLLSLISVLLLESIYFYNFTTPEFNVNVCQLPFWSIVVYLSWKIFDQKTINVKDCIFLGLFGALGFLSKYLFLYLLFSIALLFFLFIFYNKKKNLILNI